MSGQAGASRALGVITNDRRLVFQRSVIEGIEDMARRHGYAVEIDSIAEDPQHPKPISLEMDRLAGVIVIANVLPDETLRQLYLSGKPISLISHQVAEIPIPAVIANNWQGMALLMKHLVAECGRRRLVFVRGDMRQNDGIERDRAFQREVMRYNLAIPPEWCVAGEFIPAVAGESVRRLIRTGAVFDGLLASDYLMALAAVDALREAGLRVPEDVVVAGFGDGADAETAGLTTVAADVVEQGRRGTRQLIGQINGLRIRGVTILKTQLVVRETTCGTVSSA